MAARSLRAAIYARVSTSDKDQNPETQLIPLREFVVAQGWTIARVDLVLVWRIHTTSPFGEALYYITATYAQLERGILAERFRAGMDRAHQSMVDQRSAPGACPLG